MELAVIRIVLVTSLVLCGPLRARAANETEDVVSRWNVIALEAGRQDMALAQARALAMVHAAMFDAVNAVDRKYTPYLVEVRVPDRVDAEAAAAAAAHAVLIALRPEQGATLDAALSVELARVASSELREH